MNVFIRLSQREAAVAAVAVVAAVEEKEMIVL